MRDGESISATGGNARAGEALRPALGCVAALALSYQISLM